MSSGAACSFPNFFRPDHSLTHVRHQFRVATGILQVVPDLVPPRPTCFCRFGLKRARSRPSAHVVLGRHSFNTQKLRNLCTGHNTTERAVLIDLVAGRAHFGVLNETTFFTYKGSASGLVEAPVQAINVVKTNSTSASSLSSQDEEEIFPDDLQTNLDVPSDPRVAKAMLMLGAEVDVDDLQEDLRAASKKRPRSLPKDLLLEISLFRWPLRLQVSSKELQEAKEKLRKRPCVSSELLQEVREHKRQAPPPTLHRMPEALIREIVSYERPEPARALEDEDASSGQFMVFQEHNDGSSNQELIALQERCANLTTLTELLTKRYVEASLIQKKDQAAQRQELKMYQKTIFQLEEQHRSQCASWGSDKRYLEEALRRAKIESVPPIVHSRQQRRRSFMDHLVLVPMDCWNTSPTKAAAKRASFSMASTMILQNKLVPAMLSAVAHSEEEKADTYKPSRQLTN